MRVWNFPVALVPFSQHNHLQCVGTAFSQTRSILLLRPLLSTPQPTNSAPNMLPQRLLSLLCLAVRTVHALPVNADGGIPTSIGSSFYRVLICEDVYFQGRCDFVIREFGFCQRFSADWVNRISSIQPGKDSVCGIYATNNCTGLADQMVWPGSSDLVGSKFNDFSSSLRCWKSA